MASCISLFYWDSGSAHSLITFHQFQQLNLGGSELKLLPTELSCFAASGQNLEIVGEVKVTLKSQGFSWYWIFLVSKRLQGPPILGVDFISRTDLVLDFGSARCHFRFAPAVYISFISGTGRLSCSQTIPPLRAYLIYRVARYPSVRERSWNS